MTEYEAVKIISERYVVKIDEKIKAVFKMIVVIVVTIQMMKSADVTACLSVIESKTTSAESEIIYEMLERHADLISVCLIVDLTVKTSVASALSRTFRIIALITT